MGIKEMKILVSSKFYYVRGGAEQYVLHLSDLLNKKGHEVAVFAMQYPKNIPTTWSKYFPQEIRFGVTSGAIKAVRRLLGDKETRTRFSALLDDFRPDVVHLNNIHSYLSPVIGELAHRRGIRVVWTVHDYKLICPRYDCLRKGEKSCVACLTDRKNVLRYCCMKNSLLASFLAYQEARVWNRERIETFTDAYICPSRFIAERLVDGGFAEKKLHVIRNIVNTDNYRRDSYTKKGDYYCYLGRLSYEKGVKTLIRVANTLPYKLVIIGAGPLENELRKMAGSHIKFAGFRQWNDIRELVGEARFAVVPSECYENAPLSVIESLCLGTPVLGARIGGLPEMIREGENGMTFESRNTDNLRDKIRLMYETSFDYACIAREMQTTCDASRYYNRLMEIYNPA